MTYRLTGLAELDLVEIHDYTAKNSQRYARVTLERFESIFQLLTVSPLAGTPRDELMAGMKSYPVGRYIIFYRLVEDEVVVVRVLHSARDIDSWMETN